VMQRAVSPTRLIGAEDISMAIWLALDIEPAYVGFPRRSYRRLNEAVARTAVREIEELSGAGAAGYYAVASAVDYNTAYDAGRVFADAGLTHAAIGFGAYMADDHSSDYVIVGRRRVDFGARMPNRYLRTALVARGFWDGFRTSSTAAPHGFHFLGLGAPIMLGLVALAGWGTELLSFDATSPIRDAVEGTLYVSAPAPLKLRTRRIAKQLASGEREEWDCPCPFLWAIRGRAPIRLPRRTRLVRRSPRSGARACRLTTERRSLRSVPAVQRTSRRPAPHGRQLRPHGPQPLGANQDHQGSQRELKQPRPPAGAR
jgi:hypothetical protein